MTPANEYLPDHLMERRMWRVTAWFEIQPWHTIAGPPILSGSIESKYPAFLPGEALQSIVAQFRAEGVDMTGWRWTVEPAEAGEPAEAVEAVANP